MVSSFGGFGVDFNRGGSRQELAAEGLVPSDMQFQRAVARIQGNKMPFAAKVVVAFLALGAVALVLRQVR